MSGKSASAAPRPDLAGLLQTMRSPIGLRVILLLLGGLSLLAGLCAGLWRLGWTLPHGASLAALHGPLMVSGLFGTLIGLERAVAANRSWAYLAPLFAGAGSLLLILGAPPTVAAAAYSLSGIVFALVTLLILRQQPELFNAALLAGAVAWTAGNVFWLRGDEVPAFVGWWLLFLVLTIAGERLEMSRLLERKRGSEAWFIIAIGFLVTGALNGIAGDNGADLFGIGLAAVALWLARHDIAWRTVRQAGQTRFFALCMLLGYLWLACAAAALLLAPPAKAAFGYDIALHAILIGFVLSMVFGHALIILPAVTGWRLRYSAFLYAPLAVLHGSMLARLTGGLLELAALRMASGLLTVLAIAGFIATIAAASLVQNGRAKAAIRRPRHSS
ncbi:MAG TPA: hypothetical protein VF194_18590 [Ferrovibrio sp.]|uniref:hypothetical protein n=1 Tax=Ferrovibrio sp. TaxID=1917215 RepID=UPI002ED3F08C